MAEQNKQTGGLLAAFGVGATFSSFLTLLLAAKPAAGAPDQEVMDYLVKLNEGMAALLDQLHTDQLNTIKAIEDLAGAWGGAAGGELTVLTPWRADEPVQLFEQSSRGAGTLFSDSMLDCRNAKRILVKVESSLNQAITVQLVGNIAETVIQATDIGPIVPVVANGNASMGLAFDDWMPYVGVRIVLAIAPTAGILKIWGVLQR